MNEQLKQYRGNYLQKNFFEKEEISLNEYILIEDSEKKNYGQEIINGITKYYKKIEVELTDEEFDLYLKIKNAEMLEQMNSKQTTMKNIMIFWLVLTIIGIVGIFIMVGMINSKDSSDLGMILLSIL